MEFLTEIHQKSYERVAQWMAELFGEFAKAHEDEPLFTITYGSAVIRIGVLPWGAHESVVAISAPVIYGAEMTLELAEHLLVQNNREEFGAFGFDKVHNIIFFQHAIIGSTCDKNELEASVNAVMKTADTYDDQIMEQFGGLRGSDMLDQVFPDA